VRRGVPECLERVARSRGRARDDQTREGEVTVQGEGGDDDRKLGLG
jgi:hypothetical protein